MKNLLLLNYFLVKFKDLLLDVCVAQMPFQFRPLQFGLLNNLAIYLFIYFNFTSQVGEQKKLADDRSALLEEAEQAKKKMAREVETLQARVDELSANNSKLEKTRKRLQDEVSDRLSNIDFTVDLNLKIWS